MRLFVFSSDTNENHSVSPDEQHIVFLLPLLHLMVMIYALIRLLIRNGTDLDLVGDDIVNRLFCISQDHIHVLVIRLPVQNS